MKNMHGDSIQKFWTRHEVLTSWTYGVIQSKSFESDMKYWQIEHKGRFHLKALNQTWRTDKMNIHGDSIQVFNQTWSTYKLNKQGSSIQKFWTIHEVLTSWTYMKIPSKIETYMKNW
jgi:type II secretory pathway component PulK